MPLFLIPIFAALKSFGGSVLGFLAKLNPYQLALIALGLFALVQHFEIVAAHRHSRKVETQLSQCTSARHADQLAYTQAQVAAQAKNRAQVQEVEQQYQRNSDDERQAYLRDLAQLRAGRVRPQSPAAPSTPSGPRTPQAQPSTGGADADGLHLSPDEYLQAQEIELRLMHLQNYVDGFLKVDPNK